MLRKLKERVSKRHGVSRSLGTPSSTLESLKPQLEHIEAHGLLLVAEGLPVSDGAEQYPVDIIAIHGLNGDATHTWTHGNGTMWLRDLLPGFLPGCRVYTYGYPSKIFFNQSISGLQEYSRGLLTSVRDIHEDAARPIIFICHSLGGIVCKQALVIAHEDDAFREAISRSVTGIVFLGTPHRGNIGADLANVIGKMLSAAMGLMVKPGDLKLLAHNSEPLRDLALSARHRLHNLALVSFYETRPIPPLNFLIVDQDSSVLNIANEEIHPLHADHRDMCRFANSRDKSYESVSRAIRRIAARAQVSPQAPKRSSTRSSNMSFNDLEKTCILLFSVYDIADYKRLLPRPVKGTCQWIINHPAFETWRDKPENALLWLTGHPGCGKTMISVSLADYLEKHQKPGRPITVILYFCDDKVKRQKDAIGVLTGLIFQIIHRHRSMIRHVRKVYDLQGASLAQSFSSLWNIFANILRGPKSGSIFIILDALDECERKTCHQLLESIFELTESPDFKMGGDKFIKIILTSRPFLGEAYRNSSLPGCQLPIDENQPGYSDDLQTYIRHRVDELSHRRGWAADITRFLFHSLCSKVNQTFLWVYTVILSLEEEFLLSIQDLQRILSSIPPELGAIYTKFVSDIEPKHQVAASRFLGLLLACARPLHLEEINIAFTIDSQHENAKDVDDARQTSIQRDLQGILGPLIRITDSTVSLVHQSAKDFLVQNSHSTMELPATLTLSMAETELEMASACIRYLQLDDFSTDIFNSAGIDSRSEASEMFHGSQTASLNSELSVDEDQILDIGVLFREPGFVDPEACQTLMAKYKFYGYAALNWARHFSLCEESAPPGLREAARSLLYVDNWNSQNWLQSYWTDPSTGEDGNPAGFTPLVVAAYFNLHETVLCLIQGIVRHDPSIHRALLFASQQGHIRIVETLLQAGANPNADGPESQKALTAAAEHGRFGCVMALLADDRTDLNTRGGRSGRPALAFACANWHGDIVEKLLKRGECLVDQPDYNGLTPFMSAAKVGYLSVLATLAKHPEVDINHRDKNGRTALSWAAEYGLDAIVKRLLIQHGIDANLADDNGKPPLSWAAGNGWADIVNILV